MAYDLYSAEIMEIIKPLDEYNYKFPRFYHEIFKKDRVYLESVLNTLKLDKVPGFELCDSNNYEIGKFKDSPDEIFSSIILYNSFYRHWPDNDSNAQIKKKLEGRILNNYKDYQFSFFIDNKDYPPDTETTAFGTLVLLEAGLISESDANKTADKLLKAKNKDGLFNKFIDSKNTSLYDEPDYISIANIIPLFHKLGRNWSVKKSEKYIINRMKFDKPNNSSNYQYPEALFYFLTKSERITKKYQSLFIEKLKDSEIYKPNLPNNILRKAMKNISLERLGVFDYRSDRNYIRECLKEPENHMFTYRYPFGAFGSKEVTSAIIYESFIENNPYKIKK